MKTIGIILNVPWSILGIVAALLCVPKRFTSKEGALIIYVRSLKILQILPGKQGLRATTCGTIVLLGPGIDRNDLAHELVHISQYMRYPFVFPLLYLLATMLKGRMNHFEIEAYEKAGNEYRKA